MALQSYARLRSNGTPLEGSVSIAQLGGIDVSSEHIEVSELRFGAAAATARAAGAARTTGRREYAPIVFVKRIDRSTPLLYQALAQSQRVEGDFLLFDLNPIDGTIQHFFTLTAEGGGVVEISSVSPDVRDPVVATWDAYESVSLTFRSIRLDEHTSATSFEDEVRNV